MEIPENLVKMKEIGAIEPESLLSYPGLGQEGRNLRKTFSLNFPSHFL